MCWRLQKLDYCVFHRLTSHRNRARPQFATNGKRGVDRILMLVNTNSLLPSSLHSHDKTLCLDTEKVQLSAFDQGVWQILQLLDRGMQWTNLLQVTRPVCHVSVKLCKAWTHQGRIDILLPTARAFICGEVHNWHHQNELLEVSRTLEGDI
jgi:hypothetical protein